YRKFLEQRGDDPALRQEAAETYAELAAVTSDIGSKEEALKLYRRSLELFDGLIAAEPDSVPLRTRRARIHNSTGMVLDQLGRREDALAAFRRSESGIDELLRSGGPNVLKGDRANALNNMGTVYAVTNRWDKALSSFERAREIHADLLRARPDLP